MKNINFIHAAISAALVYVLGILAFIGSFFIPLMQNPNLQANLVLMLVIIPAAFCGAHLYYQRGYQTNGYVLGAALFLSAIILDALITVPVFIIPNGGTYLSFFGDISFWFIGLEYVVVTVGYWRFKVANKNVSE